MIDSLGCLFPKVNTLNLKPNFILFFSPLPLGIANALDLTDRILPRLQAQPGCRPQLLNFPPYSREELAAIVQDRLTQVRIGSKDGSIQTSVAVLNVMVNVCSQAAAQEILEASAVQFCARKVSAVSGDARKALDICR